MEISFFNDRNRIKEGKIVEMTEYCSHGYKVPCARDSSEIRRKYKFDDDGNLLICNEYDRGILWKTISYTRNEKGDYDSKKYIYPRQSTQNWVFVYNDLGQRIKETWMNGDDIWRVNEITYDSIGNFSEQLTDSIRKWTYQYNDDGRLTEIREWEMRSDPIRCLKLTRYIYENGLLTREVVQSPIDSEVSNDFQYQYDVNGHLVLVVEKRTRWISENNGPMISEVWEYTTVFENDKSGFVIQKSEYQENVDFPLSCFFYEYLHKREQNYF